jgi:hypothetical protein
MDQEVCVYNQIIPYSDPSQQPRPVAFPLLSAAHTYSYLKEADKAPQVEYHSLAAMLTRAWTTDTHTTAEATPQR